ncbi:RNA polymerase sigma factor (sigma-70 family) [Kineococcus xinjiangensis]|uniref:RNA polymerase sigma factor (Sigma-70 family) n=1 Tax=Kineococcus xinjiangensis TaxID=512762 RepID=A0A2S6IPX3_9ACTN|nr:sigma-70 family RNA polymerase sigma factor [Kineococcus xinjiangensis]PPK96146.1 RNA polymerase sigma factor (sigma-70 family) [Kineococcus xinjiangensis]
MTGGTPTTTTTSTTTGVPSADGTAEPVLAAVRRGAPGAWNRLLEQYRPLVRAVARRQGVSDSDSEDVAQLVWMRLLTGLPGIRDDEVLAAWLITTSRREAWAHRYRARREVPCEELVLPCPHDGADEPFDALDRRLALARLRRCVAVLPARERRLVQALTDPRELTYRQISRMLDMPVGAIGPVRQRALRRLRALLEAEDQPRSAAAEAC